MFAEEFRKKMISRVRLICEKIIPFERTKKELWIQFPDKATFLDEEQIVYGYLADSDGDDEVMIYCAKERAVKNCQKTEISV